MKELQGPIFQAVGEDRLHVTVCCLDTGDDQIIGIAGASLMSLKYKDDPEPDYGYNTKEITKLFEISYGLLDCYDEVKEFKLEKWFMDAGVFTCPEYRGLGIAQQLLKSRRLICKEHKIPVNGAWMTSYGTQKAAERDGWETMFEIEFKELGERFGVTFEDGAPPTSKFMLARIPSAIFK